jgi:DNA-binding CsgD family transcriptional regulator
MSDVVESAEASFAGSDYAATFDRLRRLDIATLPLPLMDRAIPLMLMSAVVVRGDAQARRIFEALERSLDPTDPIVLAMLTTYRAEATDDPNPRELLALEALSAFRETSAAPVAHHRALGLLINVRADKGMGLDENLLAEAAELERSLTLVAPVDSAEAQRGFLGYQVGDLETSRISLRILYDQADDDHQAFVRGVFSTHLAMVEIYAGRPLAAHDHLADWDRSGALPDPPPPVVLRAQGLLAIREGDDATLQALLLEPTLHGSETHGALTRTALAGIAAARRRDWREAHQELTQALTIAESLGLAEPGRRLWLDFDLATACLELGELEAAGAIADRLARLSDGRRPLLDGVASRIRSSLAERWDTNQALDLVGESVALLATAGFPDQLVLALIRSGQLLRTAHRLSDARRSLERAALVAEQSADRPLQKAVQDELAATSSDALLSSLTDREREVALAIARGDSNRMIARSSYTSVRTVETHLSSIYRKLGISSRHQLAALVRTELEP